MLFEDFLNRHIRPELNRLSFPSRIFPFFIILGILMQVVLPIFPILGREVLPNWPGLFRAVGITGLGLIGGSIAVGCMWGLFKERIRDGYVRPNFESAFALYSVVLVACWFVVYFFVGGFLYKYPTQGYRSYVLEVKPTPELKAEIEQWGLYEIKRHTPYDYSLDKQTIRYDFLDASSDPTFESREDIFFRAATFYAKPHEEVWTTIEGVDVETTRTEYPSILQHNGESKCAVLLAYSGEFVGLKSQGDEGHIKLRRLASANSSGWYDVTEAFVPIDDLGVCKLRRLDANRVLARFIITKTLLPQVHQNVFEAFRRGHMHTDFGLKHLRPAWESF